MRSHQTVYPSHSFPSFFSFMSCGSLSHSGNIYWTLTPCPELLGTGYAFITETWSSPHRISRLCGWPNKRGDRRLLSRQPPLRSALRLGPLWRPAQSLSSMKCLVCEGLSQVAPCKGSPSL